MFNHTGRRLLSAGWFVGCLGLVFVASARGQFPSQNVSLIAQLDLTDLTASAGNDCWGYVSPAGREYALMGLNAKLTVVEITNPAAPVIVGSISHANSIWADVKTYGEYCYVVNENTLLSEGMDVIDLTNIDAATNRISLVQRFDAGGTLTTSHNVAINTKSGYLYLVGSNLNGGAPVVYSLANPAAPVEVGRWNESSARYHHDAHIVTYTEGVYAGREILFGFSEERGVDILDVTDKSNIFLLSRTSYPGVVYCHQGWTSPDHKYLYVNDEVDEISQTTPTTRTLIFDISDLSNPVLVNTFTTGLPASDHNLYIDGCLMYQANYKSGLRVVNLSDPVNPVEVGFFDTFPANDSVGTDALWSVYPYFPSGTVILSDILRGLFIVDVGAAVSASDAIPGALDFTLTGGPPETIDPLGGTAVSVALAGRCGTEPAPGSAQLHYDLGSGFTSIPLTEVGTNAYAGAFPPVLCGQEIPYYFSAQDEGGATFTDPAGAPTQTYTAASTGPLAVVWQDDFETGRGWTNGPDSASTGTFVVGDPVGTSAQPDSDHTSAGVNCRYTATNPGGSDGFDDVDGGTVVTTSPPIDLSGGDAFIRYYRWFFERDTGGDDGYLAEISNDDGGSWTTIESLSSGGGGWEKVEFRVSDLLSPTGQMRLRFSATDGPASGDIVEVALDDFSVYRTTCPQQAADINRDGFTDLRDFAEFQSCHTGAGACLCVPALYGPTDTSPCVASDLDLDGDVDDADLAALVSSLTGP
jgi:choice-of-anchor B domain-containing protein